LSVRLSVRPYLLLTQMPQTIRNWCAHSPGQKQTGVQYFQVKRQGHRGRQQLRKLEQTDRQTDGRSIRLMRRVCERRIIHTEYVLHGHSLR